MSADSSDLTAITARIQRLEKDSRLWKIIAVAAFVILTAFSLSWYFSEQGELVTENFVLVDRAGKERAALTLSADGSPSLVFYNDKGRVAALLISKPDGVTSLSLYDTEGKTLFTAP